MITIEKAQLQDLESIIAIEQQVFNTGSYPPFVIRQLFDTSGEYFIVAKENSEILGYGVGGINRYKMQGWILSLGVRQTVRGKGLGKQLTERLIHLLKVGNTKEIALTVDPDNATAIKIYKDLGFVGGQVVNNYFLDGDKRIVMTLTTN